MHVATMSICLHEVNGKNTKGTPHTQDLPKGLCYIKFPSWMTILCVCMLFSYNSDGSKGSGGRKISMPLFAKKEEGNEG